MKKNLKISLVALIASGGILMQSCQKDDRFDPQFSLISKSNPDFYIERKGVFYGPTVPVGNGTARAWIRQNETGKPVEAGLDLSEKALENLPVQPAEWILYFPRLRRESFYKHMLVGWNPQGHEPEHVYDTPHFDFHFYWITNEDRLAIEGVNPPYLDPAPEAQFIPDHYFEGPGIVPQMGVHWIDLLAPEFTGGTFSRTYIWGSYNGEFIFVEPMITNSYLLSHPDELIDLREPSAYQRSGWYPKNYRVRYTPNPGRYSISLTGLTFYEGESD